MRSLFRQATRCAPCIIFIDEIDGVGETQLLTAMDSLQAHEGIVSLAATNRADFLSKAIVERFSRRMQVMQNQSVDGCPTKSRSNITDEEKQPTGVIIRFEDSKGMEFVFEMILDVTRGATAAWLLNQLQTKLALWTKVPPLVGIKVHLRDTQDDPDQPLLAEGECIDNMKAYMEADCFEAVLEEAPFQLAALPFRLAALLKARDQAPGAVMSSWLAPAAALPKPSQLLLRAPLRLGSKIIITSPYKQRRPPGTPGRFCPPAWRVHFAWGCCRGTAFRNQHAQARVGSIPPSSTPWLPSQTHDSCCSATAAPILQGCLQHACDASCIA